jgi:hypothetical protein
MHRRQPRSASRGSHPKSSWSVAMIAKKSELNHRDTHIAIEKNTQLFSQKLLSAIARYR